MKYRDALFAAAVLSLALLGCAAIAASAPYVSGTALQANSGFDALAQRVFGDRLGAAEPGMEQ